MNTPRVLFITSAHPGGRGFIGAGEGISEASLRRWITEGYEVHVLCFASCRQHANPSLVALCASYKTLNQGFLQSLLGVLGGWRSGSLIAPWFFTRSSTYNIQIVKRTLVALGNCRVWLDFASSLGFAPHLKDVHIDYFLHDVVSQNIGRRLILRIFAGLVAKIEQQLITRVKRCHVLSEKDLLLLRDLGFRGEICIRVPRDQRPGIVVNSRTASTVIRDFGDTINLVFFGNMERPENHWSMIHFLIFQFYSIRRAFPDVRLWIVGLAPRKSLIFLAKLMKNVVVTGAVDDPMPVLTAATLCIAPLRYGAGVKIKVLQMLDAGATVVATPVASEGIEKNQRLIIVQESEFAEEVCLLLSHLQ